MADRLGRPGRFDLAVQFFTSRGFAVAAVDYAGSTGYGRAYRCSLWGQWGVADAEDCLDAARSLAGSGQVDGPHGHPGRQRRRVDRAQRAGAEGGRVRRPRASWYGVTDLLALAASTHDFEAHYMDRLVGPLPETSRDVRGPLPGAPGRRACTASVLLLQGLDDPVVPPAQAEQLRDALLAAAATARSASSRGRATASAGPRPWWRAWRPSWRSTGELDL